MEFPKKELLVFVFFMSRVQPYRRNRVSRFNPYPSPNVVRAAGQVMRSAAKAAGSYAAREWNAWKGKKPAQGSRRALFTKKGTRTGRYATTAGRSVAMSGKRKRKVYTDFDKYGSVKKVENGGVANDPQCQYLGHSTAAHEQLVPAALRAVLRELVCQAGINFVQWDEDFDFTVGDILFGVTWFASPEATSSTSGTVATAVSVTTPNQLVDSMYTFMKANLTETSPIIDRFNLFRTANTNPIGTVFAKQMQLVFSNSSWLKIQNRTLATATGVDPDNEEESTTVTNNPLVGKIYSGYHDGFLIDARVVTSGTFENMLCHTQTGVIDAAAANLPTSFKKPVGGQFLRSCSKAGHVKVMPGDIKISRISFSKEINCSAFFRDLCVEIDEASTADVRLRTKFGVCEMVGLEKELDSRQAEADISLAYEVSQTYKCAGRYKQRSKTLPITEIN